MRLASLLCVLVLLPAAAAQDRSQEFNLDDVKVGSAGVFRQGDTKFRFRVDRIIGEKEMVLELGRHRFLVRGFPTKDLATDQRIELPGFWRITRTENLNGTSFFVLEQPKKK